MDQSVIDEAYTFLRIESDKTATEKGLQILRSITNQNPESAKAWFEYAGALDFLGRESEALPCYQRVFNIGIENLPEGDRPKLYLQMGSTLRNTRDFKESVRVLREGLLCYPKHLALQLFLILTQYSNGSTCESTRQLLKIVLDHVSEDSLQEYQRALRWYVEHLDDFPALREAPIFTTEHLIVRTGHESDVAAIIDYFEANRKYLEATDPPKTRGFYTAEFWQTRLQQWARQFSDGHALNLFLFLPDNRTVIGTIGFTQMARGPFHACYLGYAIDRSHEGQGLMREALRVSINYIFGELNFHRIMANHLPNNSRSAGLLKRLGFVSEGTACKYLYINGAWQDHVLTSLTNPLWKDIFIKPG